VVNGAVNDQNWLAWANCELADGGVCTATGVEADSTTMGYPPGTLGAVGATVTFDATGDGVASVYWNPPSGTSIDPTGLTMTAWVNVTTTVPLNLYPYFNYPYLRGSNSYIEPTDGGSTGWFEVTLPATPSATNASYAGENNLGVHFDQATAAAGTATVLVADVTIQ
jgi:hypothetical protein